MAKGDRPWREECVLVDGVDRAEAAGDGRGARVDADDEGIRS
jgi:hypothetical protein